MAIKHIYTGTSVPAGAPVALGHHFIDTASGNHYISKGSATVADWVLQGNFRSASLELDNVTPVSVPHVFNKAKEELQVLLFNSSGVRQADSTFVVGGTGSTSVTIVLVSGTLAGAYAVILPWKADEVKLAGDQTVNGIKTFSSIPVLPASDPTTANQAARKSYVDSKSIVNAIIFG